MQYQTSNFSVRWEQLGYTPDTEAAVRDLWRGEDLGVFTRSFSAEVGKLDGSFGGSPQHAHPRMLRLPAVVLFSWLVLVIEAPTIVLRTYRPPVLIRIPISPFKVS